MNELTIFGFKGLNRNRSEGLADMKTSWVADNVYLDSEGRWRTRPGTEKVAQLPSEVKGLYAAGGSLRAVAPSGFADIFAQQTPVVLFDFVSGTNAKDALGEQYDAATYGVQRVSGVQPFVSVGVNGKVEHHWFTDRPDSSIDTSFSSKVELPFSPLGPTIKIKTKVWSIDQVNGNVAFSSTANGPSDWTASNDAGFLPVLQHAPGSSILTALGNFRERLVVFFEDSLQVWAVDPDPALHTIVSILNGPGTQDAKSVVNALGDLVFYSRGGFRSLTTQTITGELREGDIGAPLADLDDGIAGSITAAIWWQAIGAYLVAVGDTVYCWRNDPLNKLSGWSRWQMPVAVTDFAENGTDLFFRGADDAVYRFDFNSDKDGTTPIAWSWRSQFLHMNAPHRLKSTDTARLFMSGKAQLTIYPDSTDPDFSEDAFEVEGITDPHELIPAVSMSDSMALGLTGTGAWALDGFTIQYDMIG